MLVSIWQGRARFNLASSLLGKYGFGGEPGYTCASSLNGVVRDMTCGVADNAGYWLSVTWLQFCENENFRLVSQNCNMYLSGHRFAPISLNPCQDLAQS